ncbi:uncharacterized protein LOC106068337 [Biomphalaria glabrata]|uniref:Uncharacterized protein LOC106068337 n=1 Tax=Biomphalaria glabrata TaxID=6526 RepID=A0A9W3BDX3_BIOGL|nr:uncharacterized protein LOC106068337 [Biomphalaria glabrata]XP_055897646.1 uncharacterized protein LOC106068337 [Biomphalaria glabrata]
MNNSYTRRLIKHSFNGDHETQLSECGEANLHKYLMDCKKNPGHSKFIPVGSFTLEHLPEGHHDDSLYNFIKATADLTVKVMVQMTSPRRPEQYPFYSIRGNTNLRTGSGILCGLQQYTDSEYRQLQQYTDSEYSQLQQYRDSEYSQNLGPHSVLSLKCPCKRCQHSDSPACQWWKITVVTTAHVIFDDIEASHTSLRLFYDMDDCPVVVVDTVKIIHTDIIADISWLICLTCDKSIGHKLSQTFVKFNTHIWKVRKKYLATRDIDRLAFIVSHPHGCSKQISFGSWLDKRQVGKYHFQNKFTYTTCTCPGSSGAAVHCVGYDWCGYHLVLHSGSMRSGLNYSTSGFVY